MEANNKGQTDLRRLILDEARHLLVRDGYPSLSMRKLARAIGYSATAIYLHFDSKDALIHTLIDEGMGQMYAMLSAEAVLHEDDPVACLEALCRQYVAFGLENPEYYEVMFQLHPEQMARYPAEKYRRARRNLELFTEALRSGVADGVLRVDDPVADTAALWATLHGAVSLQLARRVDVKIAPPAFVEAVVRQAVRAYTEPSATMPPASPTSASPTSSRNGHST